MVKFLSQESGDLMQERLQHSLVRYSNLLKLSLKSVLSFRLQNLLTLITMSIGAFTLSATLFIGDGARYSLWKDLEALMGSWMIIQSEPGASKSFPQRFDLATFNQHDLTSLRQNIPDTKYIEPIFSGREYISYKKQRIRVSIDGITAPLTKEDIFRPLQGVEFTESANNGYSWECYITQSLYHKLGSPELNEMYIKVRKSRFLVKAVTPDPPEADELFNKRIIVPYIFTERLLGKRGQYSSLAVGWGDMESAEETLQKVRRVLNDTRGKGTYHLSSSMFKLKKRKQIVKSFVIFGNTQALFCILVASIGILNVMLANVVRKMKEYALRMTLGAAKTDIFFIVLSESIFYALVGSLLGIVLSIWLSPDICQLVSGYLKDTRHLTPFVSAYSILLPLAICSFCGLVAGIIPALRAVRVDILSILRAQ